MSGSDVEGEVAYLKGSLANGKFSLTEGSNVERAKV